MKSKSQLEKQLGFQISTCDGKAWPITGPSADIRRSQLDRLAMALSTTPRHGMYVVATFAA